MPAPEITFWILAVVQTLHLLHHRLARRHISYVEVTAAAVLCIPIGGWVPGAILSGAHLLLAAIQVIGSVFIDKLSPTHDGPAAAAKLG